MEWTPQKVCSSLNALGVELDFGFLREYDRESGTNSNKEIYMGRPKSACIP